MVNWRTGVYTRGHLLLYGRICCLSLWSKFGSVNLDLLGITSDLKYILTHVFKDFHNYLVSLNICISSLNEVDKTCIWVWVDAGSDSSQIEIHNTVRTYSAWEIGSCYFAHDCVKVDIVLIFLKVTELKIMAMSRRQCLISVKSVLN